jgi:hypothetical protein
MSVTTIQERAVFLFSDLVKNNSNLQSKALEADAVSKLCRIFKGLVQCDLEHQAETLLNNDRICEVF